MKSVSVRERYRAFPFGDATKGCWAQILATKTQPDIHCIHVASILWHPRRTSPRSCGSKGGLEWCTLWNYMTLGKALGIAV